MKILISGVACVLNMLFFTPLSQGQSESFVISARENNRDLYDRVINLQAGLYNGRAYEEYVPVEDEHPYFKYEYSQEGSIVYRGKQYSQIPLLYDIYKSRVIIEHPQHRFMIELAFDNVDKFDVASHHFIRLGDNDGSQLKAGYYEEIYIGGLKIYAHYDKNYFSFMESQKVVKRFNEKVNYYILKEDQYYEVGSRRSVLKVLSDQKRAIKTFLRKNKIRFNRNKAFALFEIARFYDSQNHGN